MNVDPRHLVIRASAGSGKTFQLTNRYLRRLLEGTQAAEILAATFTRKAAGEILGRILLRLARAATSDQEAARLEDQLGVDRRSRSEFRSCLAELLHELHRLRIGTLDSFFAQLASNFTLELGFPPGWRIVEEQADQQLRSQAIATILREERTDDVVRLTSLLAKGEAARSVNALIRDTVNNFYDVFRETEPAAWREFPELRRLTNEQLAEVTAALEAAELPSHKSIAKARAQDVEAARAEDWIALLDRGIGRKVLDGETTFYKKQLSDGVVACYRRLLEHARAVLVQELAQQTQATWQLLDRFDVTYQQLKREHRSLRFDDVTHRLRGRLAALDTPGLAYRLDGHVRHMLLDEFQDTSPAQWQVLQPFVHQIASAKSDSSFFCVGDEKQAIYGWRGGVAEIFDSLGDCLPHLQSLPLSESYRSSRPVIETVNRLFGGLANHPHLSEVEESTVRDWCESFPSHTTAKRELPGYACVVAAGTSPSEDSEPADDLLGFTAERVSKIVGEAPDATVGVLLRKNQEVAELMNRLRGMDLPASEEGGNPITDSAAVLTVLSLLKMADHPGDTASRFHVATSPLGRSLSYLDHLDDAVAAALAAETRASLLAQGYGAVLERWTAAIADNCTSGDLKRMGQLIELGYRFDAEATLRPFEFVHFVEQERFPDPSTDRVRVMTIHSAKGLQFDVVVAPLSERQLSGQTPPFVASRTGATGPIDRVCLYRKEAIQKLLPNEMQEVFLAARRREIRETLCRLYVTVTRPIHGLHIIIPPASDDAKRLPRSPAGLVRAALTDGGAVSPGRVVYEAGDRQWFEKLPAQSPQESPSQESAVTAARAAPPGGITVRLAEMPGRRHRGLGRVAPSRHEADEPVRLNEFLRPPNTAALKRGTLIHAWFEQVTWTDEPRPSDDCLRGVAAGQGVFGEDVDAALEQFHDMLAKPQIATLLSRGSYAAAETSPFSSPLNHQLLAEEVEYDVRQELPIAARQGDDLTVGSIDRLVLLRRNAAVLAADIIDFKTDSVDPSCEPDWSKKIEQYRPQLAAYVNAVARIHEITPEHIAARLAFLEPGVVVNVSPRDGETG